MRATSASALMFFAEHVPRVRSAYGRNLGPPAGDRPRSDRSGKPLPGLYLELLLINAKTSASTAPRSPPRPVDPHPGPAGRTTVSSRVSARRGPWMELMHGQRCRQMDSVQGMVPASVEHGKYRVQWDDGEIGLVASRGHLRVRPDMPLASPPSAQASPLRPP